MGKKISHGNIPDSKLKIFSISLPSINKAEFIFNLASKFFKNDVFGLLILKSETTVSFPIFKFI